MATHAELASNLLRNAANFFRSFGEQSPELKDQMLKNAHTFDVVAGLVETDPFGIAGADADASAADASAAEGGDASAEAPAAADTSVADASADEASAADTRAEDTRADEAPSDEAAADEAPETPPES